MGDNQNKDQSCSTSKCGCCCGSKKIICTLVLGVVFFIAGYVFATAQMCHKSKICPITGQVYPVQK